MNSCNHDEIKQMSELAAANLVSVGSSLSHVHVPGHDADSHDTLGANEIEIGMGIHNEQGSKRMIVPDAPELVKLLLRQLLDENDQDRAFLGRVQKEDEFVLMINNLGGVSPLELGGITTEVVEQLGECLSSIIICVLMLLTIFQIRATLFIPRGYIVGLS